MFMIRAKLGSQSGLDSKTIMPGKCVHQSSALISSFALKAGLVAYEDDSQSDSENRSSKHGSLRPPVKELHVRTFTLALTTQFPSIGCRRLSWSGCNYQGWR